jgi:hypothetical protein
MQDIDMLQMNCSNCDGLIKSTLLAEVQVIKSPNRVEIVAVKNVVVLPPPLTTSSCLKNFLRSIKGIFRLKKYNNFDLKTKYVIGERLPEPLLRDDFRLKISYDLYGQINFGENKRFARLLNISYEGAGIEFTERGQLPENNSEATFQLLLPGYAEALSFPAKVVWIENPAEGTISPSITMGLQLKDIDKKTHKCLCGFIWGSPK